MSSRPVECGVSSENHEGDRVEMKLYVVFCFNLLFC